MTTTTERLDRATFQRRWSDDLAAAHTEARDKWAEAAAESAGELRAFADFLHELDVPGLVAMADDLAEERLAETAEWPAWAELDFAELAETPNRPSQIRHTHDTDAGGNCRHPNCGFNSDELHFEFDDDGPRYELALVQRRTRVIRPTSVIPAEPDLEMGREIRAALSRPALIRGSYIPDKPAETADEYMEQDDIEGEPWQQWLRRSLGDLWKQVWPR